MALRLAGMKSCLRLPPELKQARKVKSSAGEWPSADKYMYCNWNLYLRIPFPVSDLCEAIGEDNGITDHSDRPCELNPQVPEDLYSNREMQRRLDRQAVLWVREQSNQDCVLPPVVPVEGTSELITPESLGWYKTISVGGRVAVRALILPITQ